jgi:hypothetical protein
MHRTGAMEILGSIAMLRSLPPSRATDREPEPELQRAQRPQAPVVNRRPSTPAALLALQRLVGNRAVAGILARALPKSTEEWDTLLSKGDRNDPELWVKIITSLDNSKTYTAEMGVVVVEGHLRLHPRKLESLLRDGMLTRVLERVPSKGADLSKDDGAKFVRDAGLKFDADFAPREEAEKKGEVDVSMIESSRGAPAKEAALKYVGWIEKNATHILGKTFGTAQKINHAQFFLESATKLEASDELFKHVADRYTQLMKAKDAPQEGQDRLAVDLHAPFEAVTDMVKMGVGKLNFVSPSAALYHAAKHWRELFPTAAQKLQTRDQPLREALGTDQVDQYVNGARDVIAHGTPKRGGVEQRSAGFKIEFEARGITAIVHVRSDGSAVIASAHMRGAESGAAAATPEASFASTFELKAYGPGKDEMDALWMALNARAKQSDMGKLMDSADTVAVAKKPSTILFFDLASQKRQVEVAVTLGAATRLVAKNAEKTKAAVELRITYLDDLKAPKKPVPSKDITGPVVVAELEAALDVFMNNKDEPDAKAILTELKRLKAAYEDKWKDVGTLRKPGPDVIKEALKKREAFEMAFAQHVRLAADGGQSLRKALDDDEAKPAHEYGAEFDPLSHQITAQQTFAAHAKTNPTTAVTPALLEHLLFPASGATGQGVSGGHIDANLKKFLAANPKYSVVERAQAKFDKYTLRLYDQYLWDPTANKGDPPAPDKADERPSKDRDMSAHWTKTSTPKTTADAIEFFLEGGDAALIEAIKADSDFISQHKGSFGATQKGAIVVPTSPNGDKPGFSGHVGWSGDSPFFKTLYLSIDWITKHDPSYVAPKY